MATNDYTAIFVPFEIQVTQQKKLNWWLFARISAIDFKVSR